MVPDASITPLFWGAIEATEEAILNALVAADTLVGRDGITAHALPHDRLVEIMTKHGRGPADNGRGGGIRTRDLVLPKHVRCQAALRPACAGILRPGTVVTCDRGRGRGTS